MKDERTLAGSTLLLWGVLVGVAGGVTGLEAQSVHPVRLDHPEVEEATTPDVEKVDPEIFQVEAATDGQGQLTISRNTVDALCGDGNGCGLRLILLGGGSPRPESATFAISSGDWGVDLDGSSLSGRLSDFHDVTILSVDVTVPTVSSQHCLFGELTSSGGNVSVLAFELVADNDSASTHRCVLRIDD